MTAAIARRFSPSVQRRAGYTLIEIMIVMVIATALMALISVAVVQVILANGASGRHLNDLLALGELGEQFRSDVHQSQRVAVSPPDAARTTLVLTAANGDVVEYEITGLVLQRMQTANTKPTRRESYTFGRMRVQGWRKSGQQDDEVIMSIARMAEVAPGSEPAETGSFEIVAILGGAPSRVPAPE
jgi:prepilin-type N-terminal cleavage/methylation domain-containing protein